MLLRVRNHCVQLNDAPDPIEWNAVALEYIKANLKMVYEEPYLIQYSMVVNAPALPAWKKQPSRKDIERKMLMELSQYFASKNGMWSRTKLLSKCKDGCIQRTGDIPTYLRFYQCWTIWRITLDYNKLRTGRHQRRRLRIPISYPGVQLIDYCIC
jgi:hypothetical protein